MANKVRYKIEESYDRQGNDKAIPTDWINREYFIHHLAIGSGAILMMEENTHRHLHTSTVEDITVWENTIRITTRNTVYVLVPEVITDEKN